MPSINRPIRSVPKCAARRLCERHLRAAQPPEAPCASLLPTPQPTPSAIFGIREVIERCLALRARGKQLAMHSRKRFDRTVVSAQADGEAPPDVDEPAGPIDRSANCGHDYAEVRSLSASASLTTASRKCCRKPINILKPAKTQHVRTGAHIIRSCDSGWARNAASTDSSITV